jgi:hypothetical protein
MGKVKKGKKWVKNQRSEVREWQTKRDGRWMMDDGGWTKDEGRRKREDG